MLTSSQGGSHGGSTCSFAATRGPCRSRCTVPRAHPRTCLQVPRDLLSYPARHGRRPSQQHSKCRRRQDVRDPVRRKGPPVIQSSGYRHPDGPVLGGSGFLAHERRAEQEPKARASSSIPKTSRGPRNRVTKTLASSSAPSVLPIRSFSIHFL